MIDITNKDFGVSKAIHSPIDKQITASLTNKLSDYVQSTDQSNISIEKRKNKLWEVCQQQVRKYLEPVVDLSEFKYAYPTNGIHESIDCFLAKTKHYQVFTGEYRYPTILKQPNHVADNVIDLIPHMPLYMSNPFSATGNFDKRYDEVGIRLQCPIYLDLAFVGTTAEHKIEMYENVQQVFWSCSKPYGLNLLRSGIRFSRKEEPLQKEIQGAGYFNPAIIDVFNQVTQHSSVFAKSQQYKSVQEKICKQFDLVPSDSCLVATTQNKEWDRFKRENGVNRVCLTPAYEIILNK